MLKQFWEVAQSVELAVRPFRWIWPRYDRAICDSTVFCGPIVIRWTNYYLPQQGDLDPHHWSDYI